MKASISCLLSIARAAQNRRRLAELSLAFADVRVVPLAMLPWNRVALDRTNGAWASLLRLAKLLLGKRFQTTSSGSAPGFSLLFEMNSLFEEYIGLTLRSALVRSGIDVRLQGPRDHALVADDDTRRFATKPDIVLSYEGEHVLIIDTKWKRLEGAVSKANRGVGQDDVYQMMAYAQVYRCSRLMLLYPYHNEISSPVGRLETLRIRGTRDTRLSVASVSLSDLPSLGGRLRELACNEIESDFVRAQAMARN